jgi:hypothetical protein
LDQAAFPRVKTPGYFQASFPDAKTDGTCEPPADEVAPKRSLGHWRFGCYNDAAPLALALGNDEGRRMKTETGRFSRISRLAGSFSQPGRTKFQREPVKFLLGRTKFRLELDARMLELVKGGSELDVRTLELDKFQVEPSKFGPDLVKRRSELAWFRQA